jgi:hypothetical protein
MKCTHKEIGKPHKASAFLGKNRKTKGRQGKSLPQKGRKSKQGNPGASIPQVKNKQKVESSNLELQRHYLRNLILEHKF